MGSSPFEDRAGTPKGPLDSDAWDARWQEGNTPWDMGDANPVLADALAREVVTPPGRALVVGCGAGHDARTLAGAGFDVTAVDHAPGALDHARRLAEAAGSPVDFVLADLFELPDALGAFDLVFEHTCFCAIDPSRRDEYVDAVADALGPDGRLLGVFFDMATDEGPPFGASPEELRHRFGRRFDVEFLEPAKTSSEKRAGKEVLGLFRRR